MSNSRCLTTRCSGPPLLRFGEKPVPATYFRSALRADKNAVLGYWCFGVSALRVPFFYSVTSPLRDPVTSFLRVLCDLCGENALSSRPSAVSASGDASYNVSRLPSYVLRLTSPFVSFVVRIFSPLPPFPPCESSLGVLVAWW
jgi:hypothetical protein